MNSKARKKIEKEYLFAALGQKPWGFRAFLTCRFLPAMARWSCQDFQQELLDMERLYSLRPDAPLVPKMVESLLGKVQGITTLSASNLLTLTQALKEYPDKYKEQLQSRFEERALNETSSALKLQTQPQILTTVYNYLNESEWKTVQGKGPSDTMPLIARRLKACGLKSLKETTKKHCVAVVLHCMLQRGEVRPPSTELYQLVCYFQDTFHACTQPPLTASLSKYPTKPMHLGEEFVQKLYTKRRWVCCCRQRSAIECVQFARSDPCAEHEQPSGFEQQCGQAEGQGVLFRFCLVCFNAWR